MPMYRFQHMSAARQEPVRCINSRCRRSACPRGPAFIVWCGDMPNPELAACMGCVNNFHPRAFAFGGSFAVAGTGR